MAEEFLTVEQVAERLQVHPNTVRRWIDAGVLRKLPLPGRAVRIPASELARLAERPPRFGDLGIAFTRELPVQTSVDGDIVRRGEHDGLRLAMLFDMNQARVLRVWRPGGTVTRAEAEALGDRYAPPFRYQPGPTDRRYVVEALPDGKGWLIAEDERGIGQGRTLAELE